jgi:hypothetical protein
MANYLDLKLPKMDSNLMKEPELGSNPFNDPVGFAIPKEYGYEGEMMDIPELPEENKWAQALMYTLGNYAREGAEGVQQGISRYLKDNLANMELPQLTRTKKGFLPDGSPALDEEGNQITMTEPVNFGNMFSNAKSALGQVMQNLQNQAPQSQFGDSFSRTSNKEPWMIDEEGDTRGGY